MRDFLTAIALALVLEGLAYALFPQGMKAMMTQVLEAPPAWLRAAGLLAAIVGVLLVALLRRA